MVWRSWYSSRQETVPVLFGELILRPFVGGEERVAVEAMIREPGGNDDLLEPGGVRLSR